MMIAHYCDATFNLASVLFKASPPQPFSSACRLMSNACGGITWWCQLSSFFSFLLHSTQILWLVYLEIFLGIYFVATRLDALISTLIQLVCFENPQMLQNFPVCSDYLTSLFSDKVSLLSFSFFSLKIHLLRDISTSSALSGCVDQSLGLKSTP